MGKRGAQPNTEMTDKQKRFVAAFVSQARGNATEAARIAGYSAASQQALWVVAHQTLRNPKVSAAIEAAFAEFRDEGAAIKRLRLSGKQERLAACWAVIDGRAARYRAKLGPDALAAAAEAARAVFGGGVPFEAATGLLVEKETVNNAGHRTTDWSVDTGLLKEMRELEADIAAEVGEAPTQRMKVEHSGNVTHTHRRPDYSALSDDELDLLAELAEKVAAGTVAG